MRYDAFISYRHTELDMDTAKKVHSALETYRIPGAVRQKTGKKKMGRIFRDQEELPIGSDLDDNISEALRESEYLIVICSPRTPGSFWVCKEIETFIEMHDREHILAVLIEGEPDESFPPSLLVDDKGRPVEPLAADVRGSDKKERNRKFRTEILRLAAPIIGCTYDDLKQRHRERVIKRTIAVVSAAAAVLALAGTAFGLYNAGVAAKMKTLADQKAALADEKAALADEKTRLADEISIQYRGKQENQSRFYAQEAMSLFRSGNREDAILVAMEGLPSVSGDRPYVPEAEYALSRALYAYDCGRDMTYDRTLRHRLTVSKMTTTEDRQKIITIDAGSRVYVWNVKDWSLLSDIAPALNDSNYFVNVNSADADDTGVYTTTDHELTKYDLQGNVLYRKKFNDTIKVCDLCGDTGKLVLVLKESFLLLNASDGEVLDTHESEAGYSFYDGEGYSRDHGLYVAAQYSEEAGKGSFAVYDMDKSTLTHIHPTEGTFLKHWVTMDGNIAVISCNPIEHIDDFKRAVVDCYAPEGTLLWSRELPAHVKNALTFMAHIKDHKYTTDGTEHRDLVIALEAEAFTLDERTGAMISSFTLPGDASALSVALDSPTGRVGYRQGDFDLVDFSEGRIYSEHTFQTEGSISAWVVLGEQLAFLPSSSTEIYVVSWHKAPDIEEHITLDENIMPERVSDDGTLYALRPDSDYQTYIIMNTDGSEACRYHGDAFIRGMRFIGRKACFWDAKKMTILDPKSGNKETITPADYGFSEFSVDFTLNRKGDKCVFWDSASLMVFDLEEKKVVCEYRPEETIGSLLLSDDGSRICIADQGGSLRVLDTVSLEEHSFKDENIRTVAEVFFKDFMALSPDGCSLALCCADGMMRVADTASFETVAAVPLESYLRSYISFTDDGSHIVVQGDDYRIRIFDMSSGTYVTTLDGSGSIAYIVCDERNGLMAACTGTSLYLFETKGYGRVAYAEDGLLYLKSNSSILMSIDRREIRRTYYKDFKKLMTEAARQFPGAVLTDEKKAEYNID